ncbi:conditioned medium-induced protein 4 [Halobacteria archaeon AArc-dxtr1]|nr:conditioned medium-induced protein 4 [Halobacteria archaeon AArc-dxtr1]
MNEKTEELRDIFTSVTDGADTVTESQEDTRGSLEKDEQTVETRVHGVIARMRDRYGLETDLDDDALTTVATGFYEGASDAEIAADLERDESAVFDARMALHLIDERDADEVDLVAIREREEDAAALADEYDVDEAAIRRYRRVATARDESRAANDRYRDEFDSILADADISKRMAADVRKDGLDDATDGMETDVSF